MIANDLLKQDFIVLEENPRHRRSSFVTLTKEGERVIRRMRKRESQLYHSTKFGVKRDELRTAVKTLAHVRDALKGIA